MWGPIIRRETGLFVPEGRTPPEPLPFPEMFSLFKGYGRLSRTVPNACALILTLQGTSRIPDDNLSFQFAPPISLEYLEPVLKDLVQRTFGINCQPSTLPLALGWGPRWCPFAQFFTLRASVLDYLWCSL